MKHLGDITKINGAEIEPVDCIIGGSPCQDLSVVGKRAGLAGERSGLFMEQIRIVKEMREHDRRIKRADDDFRLRPRYMVWENVPGAFSSNKGKDFQAVLTEIVRIVRPDAPDVPLPDRGGWSKSGCIMGYGSTGCPFSIAWRLHDAQFWGCAQRRKRIALVADFGGFSAPEICFERNGLRGDSSESGTAQEGVAATVKGGAAYPVGADGKQGGTVKKNGSTLNCYCYGMDNERRRGVDMLNDQAPAITARAGTGGNNIPCVQSFCLQGNGIDRADTAGCNGRGWCEDVSYTLNTIDRPTVYENHGQDCRYKQLDDVSETVSAKYGTGGNNQPLVLSIGNGQTDAACCSNADVAHTLNCMHDPLAVCISGTYQDKTGTLSPSGHPGSYNGQDAYNDMLITSVDCRNASEDPNINATLQANPKTVNNNNVCRIGSQVRRLTPLECERLQGFPDGWTDIGEWVDSKGKKHKESDSPRYKALGNSIAVGYANNGSGFWMWLLKRISAQYERNATLGSLFDGIGGFPLAWEHFNGKGSARWASEIEEFPIAVTKKHFPEE